MPSEGRTPSLEQRLRYGPYQAWINSQTSNPAVIAPARTSSGEGT